MYRSIPKPPMPPRANPRAFDFFENFWSNSPLCCQLGGQMPHPLELQRGSNPPPTTHVKQTLETSSAKFSATTNFLFSLSSLHTLNKGIFHDRTIYNDNNRKTHVESARAMTGDRERGSRAELKNCEILLLPTADRRFDTKVKFPTGRASFWVKFPTVRSLTRVKCPGIARGGGWTVLELTGTLINNFSTFYSFSIFQLQEYCLKGFLRRWNFVFVSYNLWQTSVLKKTASTCEM